VGVARALAVHDQRVVDLARVDHHGGQVDPVEEAEAGVGQVEVEAGRGQAERGVHRGGRRRLQVGPAHRGVDQQADIGRVHPRLGQRLGACHRGGIGEAHVAWPPPALDDPGQPLQQPGPQAHPVVGVGQPIVELRGRHDAGGVDPADGHDRCAVEAEGGVAGHASPLERSRGRPLL